MKSMFQFMAAIACVAALTACGGGSKKAETVVVVQPDYKITVDTAGTGELAAQGDLVVVRYAGFLYDSTKSDFKGAKVESSIDTNTTAPPFTLGVGLERTGWDKTLIGMRVGGKRTVVLPANLAYGTLSRAEVVSNGITYAAIPSNSPLVYDLELVSLTKIAAPVVVPPSGNLEITDTKVGSGTAAATGKTLTVSYSLYLYDGTRVSRRSAVVETSASFAFALGGNVIAGWNQGLVGMMPGGVRTLQIPPSLGYGATAQLDSAGAVKIPANSTLIFDITLISVQ